MAYRENNLSHACIVTSPSAEECRRNAVLVAAKMLCSEGRAEPCRVCRNCRKVFAGIHPDVIEIKRELNSKGNERSEIVVSQIRDIIAEAFVRPNEAERKVFVIWEAETMNNQSQNTLLKVLEEPPHYVSFILCTTNPAMLLDTVRSRCEELRVGAENEEESDEAKQEAAALIKAVAAGDRAELLTLCTMQGTDQKAAQETIGAALSLIADELCFRGNLNYIPRSELMGLYELFSKMKRYLNANVNFKSVYGMLSVSGLQREKGRN